MEILNNEQIKSSKCFGLAFDASVKECKICEASKLCKQQTENGVIASTSVTNKKSNKKYIEDTNDLDDSDNETIDNTDTENEAPKNSKKSNKKVSSSKANKKKMPVEEDDDLNDEEDIDDIEDEKPSKKSDKKSSTKKSDKKKSNSKKSTPTDSSIPEFKQLSTEELFELAEERGINLADFDKYTAPAIKRMRVTMALKKTYQE